MIYFKINNEIKNLIQSLSVVKNREISLGCKHYCTKQIIALDELQLLNKLLKKENIKDMSSEEFKNLKNSTSNLSLRNLHICEDETLNKLNSKINYDNNNQQNTENEHIMNNINIDKFPRRAPPMFRPTTDYSSLNKLEQQKEKDINNGRQHSYNMRESSASYGINLIVSFFLVIFGSFWLCKYIFELSDLSTFKITLVISIVVMFAEAMLLLIKLDKESKKEINLKGLKKGSFAYKFNKSYRDKLDIIEKKKQNKTFYNKYKTD